MCSSLALRQYLLEILKSNQPIMHIILFVFERASRGYLAHLDRSSVEEVMAVTRILHCPQTFTRPGELLHYKFTRPGTAILREKGQKVVENDHPAGWILLFIIPPGRVRYFGVFSCQKRDFWWEIKGKTPRVHIIKHLPPPTLTHTSKNTLREGIEDWRLPIGRLKLPFHRFILTGVS